MEGRIARPSGPRAHAGRWLLALWAIALPLLLFRLGAKDVWEASEGRPLESAREMRAHGDWLVQYTNGAVDLTKPPLYAWAVAAAFGVAGEDSEAAGRLPSVLASLGVLAAAFVLAARVAGPRAGFLAGLALLTTAKFLWQARLAEMETLLALGATWAYVAFDAALEAESGRARWGRFAGFHAAVGFAFAVKGPVALLVVLPGALAYAAATRRLRATLAAPAFWGTLPAMLLVGLPWYAAVVARDPSALATFLAYARGENVGHLHDPFYYLVQYPLYALPWTPWVVLRLARPLAARLGPREARRARLAVAAFLVTFVLQSALHAKQTHYLVPTVFPMGAVLAGLGLDAWIGRAAPGARFGAVLGRGVPAAAAILGLASLLLPEAVGVAVPCVAAAAAALAGAALLLARRRGFRWGVASRVEAALLLLLAAEGVGVGWVVPSFDEGQSGRTFFGRVAEQVPPGAPLAWTVFGSHSDYLWYLPMSLVTTKGIPEVVGRDEAETVARVRAFLAGGGRRYAVVTSAQAEALGDAAAVLVREGSLQKKRRDVALVRSAGGG